MAITISVGLQKGGVSKTTTSAIMSYLLAKESRVLAVDFDSQGNLSEMLSRKNSYEFEGKTVYEACRDRNPAPYLFPVSERLHLLPAEDELGLFANLLGTSDRASLLKQTLAAVQDQYDYIIIDQAPHLGEATVNALYASDYTLTPLLAEPFSYKRLQRYLRFVQQVQAIQPGLSFAGILLTLFDPRSSLDNVIRRQLFERYPDLMFKTVIKKRVRIKEYSASGIREHTKADRLALQPYAEFVKELIASVGDKS